MDAPQQQKHLSAENAQDQQGDAVEFDVELREGEDLGIQLTDGLQIVKIRPGGPFDTRCIEGDKIIQINEHAVKTPEEFEHALINGGPVYHFKVTRGLKADVSLLPPDREKNVQRREGYSYHLTQIDYQKGCKFGLGIKHYQNRVLVSRIDDGSLSAKCLLVGDRIVDVNGTPVTDKDVTRNLLLKSLQKTRTVNLVIERPETQEAKGAIRQALSVSEIQPPSVAMASDIQEIVKRQKENMAKQAVEPKKAGSILRTRRRPSKEQHAQVTSARKEVVIATDHEGKALKPVPSQK